jgi:hypothetical protein
VVLEARAAPEVQALPGARAVVEVPEGLEDQVV